jgi:hypothetical protein
MRFCCIRLVRCDSVFFESDNMIPWSGLIALSPLLDVRMFMGVDAEGINREVSATLESAKLCRLHESSKSFAIPEAALFKMASLLLHDEDNETTTMLVARGPHLGVGDVTCHLQRQDIARGILPSLRYLVKKELLAGSWGMDRTEYENGVEITEAKRRPDSHLDSMYTQIEPYGSDFFCKICYQEISNTYFHCEG